MLKQFVSAASVASVVIAVAAGVMLNLPGIDRHAIFPLLVLWLCAPAFWGVWAMLAPRAWIPRRLPTWGGALGAVLGALGALVVNLPLVIFGVELSLALRTVAIPIAAALYFLLWMVVRRVYLELQPQTDLSVK